MKTESHKKISILEYPNRMPWEEDISALCSISEIYHENTKIRSFYSGPMPGWAQEMLPRGRLKEYTSYPGFKKIKLSKNFPFSDKPVEEVLLKRRSTRDFSEEPLTISEISKLLFFSYGITEPSEEFRGAPSAGALYPIEIYLAILNALDFKKGIYHYNVKNHLLELFCEGDFREDIYRISPQDMIKTASLVLLMNAAAKRTKVKYGERGYRYILFDAGHIAENIYLMAEAMGLGCAAIGGFLDDEVNKLLGVDGVNEFVVYALAVGRKRMLDDLSSRVK